MFTLTIRTDNAAFRDDYNTEIARILEEVADRVRDGAISGACRDVNGNTVGGFGFDDE